MPGVLALLHVTEGSGEADSQGLHRKGEEGNDSSLTSQDGLFPSSCQRVTTTWGWDWGRGLDRKMTVGRVPQI